MDFRYFKDQDGFDAKVNKNEVISMIQYFFSYSYLLAYISVF